MTDAEHVVKRLRVAASGLFTLGMGHTINPGCGFDVEAAGMVRRLVEDVPAEMREKYVAALWQVWDAGVDVMRLAIVEAER